MLRPRHLSWIVICSLLLSTLAPIMPVRAASHAAVASPIRQDDLVDRIAEIRNESPDLEENFDDANTMFVTGYDGTTVSYFKFGELRIAVDEENTLAWSFLDQEVADYYMEVEAIHREGAIDNQFGMLARLDDSGNYYMFAASSDGYYTIQMHVDGEWESLVEWEETDTVNVGEGELNTLGLLVEGDTYTLLVNDIIVDSVSDDTLDGPRLAINAAAFSTPPIEIGFDNFRLWYVGEPPVETPRQAPVDGRNVTGTPEPTPSAIAPDGPTPEPTEEPTLEPTDEPTVEPTDEPTPEPTDEPTTEPTDAPTSEPTSEPTDEPTDEPTETPTAEPTSVTGTSSDPTIAAIQGQPPTFSDDFEDGDASDWLSLITDAVTYEVVDGAYNFVFNSANVLTWSELPVQPVNFYLELDATVASPTLNAEYGIIYNYVDPQNFDFFAISNGSRFSLWRLANNSWELVRDWEDAAVLLAGEGNANRLGLLVQDTTVRLLANNEVLAEIDNSDGLPGGIAIAAGTFEEAALTVSFDNVQLWDLDTIDLAPVPEPTSEPTSEPTAEPTGEPTTEPTGEPTSEPTSEPTDEPVSGDFAEVEARIAEIVAADPDISDDFRRDTGAWDTTADNLGDYFYENRMFQIESTTEQQILLSAYFAEDNAVDPAEFTDFYVEFDTSFVVRTGENAAGLIFRMVDSDNFYKFIVDEIGFFQFQKRVDGEYADIIEWEATDAADDSDDAVNRLGILAEGSSFAFTVNGEVIAVAEDPDLASGAIALAIQTYTTPEGHSTFDNLDLWILDE